MRTSTLLWFDNQAEQAAEYYTKLFPASRILHRQRAANGQVSTVTFEVAGQRLVAYNGSVPLTFTPAIALYVECDSQHDIDTAWSGLTDGGTEGPGGSLTDRFGVTWHVVPRTLGELLADAAPDCAEQILTDLHAMTKISVQGLIDAGARAAVHRALS
ncbi:putative 3-demethylubiquinone-9 3-methyltransferase (glyoxalase superfamily) [Kribbella amoyensis]|uniref:Putative 3-demethylubiquinone-9 3-methyltransferase (Glyoxalase superfamily) n=1 Tax=Kribbella amoyensis TaxID=996641 RepID=A0A561BMK7_9ACTN|nr:VOC family protein [Kribbella amoyensis]TWD80105.1 putative 3-demethylubiquinone-9 3-methyltransferase (glyoxalase superfamily) [Kribbella amoyensis]